MSEDPNPDKDSNGSSKKDGADEIVISENPVREMFLLALLYLPLGFFLWFYLASALMWLPTRLTD